MSAWSQYRLLCRILGGSDQTALNHAIVQNSLPDLAAMAAAHQVLPALALRCSESASGAIATPQRVQLQSALLDNTQRNMQILAQTLKLTRCLNAVSITPLLLKGSALLLTANKDKLGFREQVDIDLIVPEADLTRAWHALIAHGYSYSDTAGGQSTRATDLARARQQSAVHHHLPPLSKPGYDTTVELHYHYLPKRFQARSSLEELFFMAVPGEFNDIHYLIPAPEHQVIHLLLGTYIHDGWCARQLLPLRQACDFIELQTTATGSAQTIDWRLVRSRCGNNIATFAALVSALMVHPAPQSLRPTASIAHRLTMMRCRYNSTTAAQLLNACGRVEYLLSTLLSNPGKLPGYVSRLTGSSV